MFYRNRNLKAHLSSVHELAPQIYKEDPGPAFAILKSVLAVASCVSLFYTGSLPLDVQISILIVMALLGSACFAWVDVKSRRRMSAAAAELRHEQNSYGTVDK